MRAAGARRPSNLRAAGHAASSPTFVGRAARLPAVVEQPGLLRVGDAELRAAETPATGAAEIFIRPHHVRPLRDGEMAENILPATLSRRTYTGDLVTLDCATPAGRLIADLPGGSPGADLRVGDSIRLGFRAADVRVFAA
jgi:putative spermidine/putrescine transport system ATP-binding protein